MAMTANSNDDSTWLSVFFEGPESRDAQGYESSNNTSDLEPMDWQEPELGDSAPLMDTEDEDMRAASDIHADVLAVLSLMQRLKLKLPVFLHAILWGNELCVQDDTVRGFRTSLTGSRLLPNILRSLYHPPRISHGTRPHAATSVVRDLAVEIVEESMDLEMTKLSAVLYSRADDDLTEAELTSASFKTLIPACLNAAPTAWRLLFSFSYSERQMRHNTRKNPDKILCTVLCVLCYLHSKNCGRLQKALSFYLKFKGLSAKAFDTLHALGLVMSHKWTCNAVAKISERAMAEVVAQMHSSLPYLISYDNVNLPFRVFAQRVDHQTTFGCGTASTCYIQRGSHPLPPEANSRLKRGRAQGLENPLTALDILDLELDASVRLERECAYHILRILLDSPDFDLATYEHRSSRIFLHPSDARTLPHGPEHTTLQYMLGTEGIPESTYEDQEKFLKLLLSQLHLYDGDPVQAQKLAEKTILFLVGDQLTVERLRGMYKFRAEEFNSFDRLDWLQMIFGWLHLLMAFANGLYSQYFGTGTGRGISQAIDVLNRKGLNHAQTKGVFYHDVDELLLHMLEAHLRIDWLNISGVEKLSQLRSRTPEQLSALAMEICRKCASTQAMDQCWGAKMEDSQRDESRQQTIMFVRDVLQYVVLRSAVKHGRVGIMEDMLPTLLYRFSGGKNRRYALEVLELMQNLYREWPAEVSEFVRHNCWLVNMHGRADSFLPIDEAQEHNIRDIKVSYHSEGPNIDWDYMKTLHPAIPIINRLNVHIEQEFETYKRGKRHSTPNEAADVAKLQAFYEDLHAFKEGRYITQLTEKGKRKQSSNRAHNFWARGFEEVSTGGIRERWQDNRYYVRSTSEDWLQTSDSD